ncbi:MAG: 5-(carboxyamino)imidazole ribonucleotide mutase [Planctomycetia bacterium]|uniref:5-(carboxyamino)imidazole ribonucleotide mutase n=1 Tax=Candidatus Kuenenia sp. TaxID=2499824 RepID=UPI001DCE1006|nr:5-(carboxyamino)imidazole ribonucleotide mutase [Planctomycetia bacterium]
MKKIGVVMGSDSDAPIMKEAVQTLKEFGLDFDVNVISAHRSPERAHSYALEAEKKYEVIIVGAGGAAHLAGVIASLTPVPVIGIPMPTSELRGLDSLLSTVQMPSGIPVSTMGIGKTGAINAAILAIQILSVADPALRQKIVLYKKQLSDAVSMKDQGLRVKLGQ